METLSEADLYWLAGLMEGEGCFSLDRGTYPRVYLRMTDEDVVERAHQITGIGSVHFAKQQGLGWKPTYCWQVNTDAVDLMTLLKPLMGSRRQKRITEVLEAFEKRPVKRKIWKGGDWVREQATLLADGTKRCVRCLVVQPVEEFYLDNRTQKRRGHCMGCHHPERELLPLPVEILL